jgi:uracil-DNA glycosylase
MNWDLLEGKIKSCKKCDGLNSVELGTQNAPGYGSKNSNVVFLG